MKILKFKEAAEFLRISPRHLRDLVETTDIPRRQQGPRARIYFVQERIFEWWDRASTPTPTTVKTRAFKLIRRSRRAE